MSETIIGYARCSTDEQDLTAQRERLAELGVVSGRIYLDHGLTGTLPPSREWPASVSYARTSTARQELASQLTALQAVRGRSCPA